MPSNKNAQAIMAAIATDKSKVLGVVIGDKKIEPPGLYIPRAGNFPPQHQVPFGSFLEPLILLTIQFCVPGKAEAKPLPQISFAVPNRGASARYVVVSMDFDAPYPSAPFFGPVLHWIQPNLRPMSSDAPAASEGEPVKLEIEDAAGFIANYASPNPPPGSSPHRYGFYLYEQPEGFDASRWKPEGGEKLGNMARIRYSLDDWEKEAGLGPILAANYFTSN